MMRVSLAPAAIALLLTALGFGCAGRPLLDGPARSAPLRVDGAGDDWTAGLQWMENLGLSLAAQHDGEAIYLAVATGDEQLQAAILARGLTLWLDGAGGEERRLGLRFPSGLGWMEGEGDWGGPPPGAAPQGRPGPGEAASGEGELARRERLAAQLATLPAEFLLLRGKDDGGRLTGFSEVPGLEIAAGLEGSRLLIEWRLPLAAAEPRLWPFALEGERLGLGLALAELPQGSVLERREGRSAPPMGMGMPSRNGRRPGSEPGGGMRDMGSPPPQRGPKPAALNGWVTLRLAP